MKIRGTSGTHVVGFLKVLASLFPALDALPVVDALLLELPKLAVPVEDKPAEEDEAAEAMAGWLQKYRRAALGSLVSTRILSSQTEI